MRIALVVAVDWRNALGYSRGDTPDLREVLLLLDDLTAEANSLSDNGRFGMHVGIDALRSAVKLELK